MRARSFVYVCIVYVGALAAAAITCRAMTTLDPIWALALADVAATIVVFVGSRRANNSSIYDAYWSLIPMAISVWFATLAPELSLRAGLVLMGMWAWGARLTFNWARGWPGLHHEDWRYVDLRKKTGKLYWPVSFLALHFFPTVLTWLGSLPMLPAMQSNAALSWVDGAAVLVTVAAIALETISDEQLRNFRAGKPTGACDVGLWKYSRHPNYFGEILFWVGIWLFGVAGGAPTWMVAGPVAMVALFLFASIPMAEKHALARRPEYAQRIAKVSMLVPWFPKKA